jgi:MFS family permease
MSQTLPSESPSLMTQSARPTWVRWHIVALLIAYSFMTWFNRVSMSVAYDERIKDEHGITPEQMGYVYSTFLFFYMLCMTPGGWLIDRFGPWAALVVMGLGSAAFGALTGCAGQPALVGSGLVFVSLLVIRSTMGALTAPVYPAAARVVSHWLPMGQRARANGMVQGAAAVGIACAFPVFGTLIDWVDWPLAFFISAAATALVAILWLAYATNDPAQHRGVNEPELREINPLRPVASAPPSAPVLGSSETGISTARRTKPVSEVSTGNDRPIDAEPVAQVSIAVDTPPLWRNTSLWLLTLSYAAISYVEYLFFFWMHYYFEDILHLGKANSRWYAAVLTLAMAVGMVVGGLVADRLRTGGTGAWRHAAVPVCGMCAGAVLLVLGVLAAETALIMILLSLALAAVGACEAPVWTLATEMGGRHGGTAAAICNTGGNAGGLIAPIVTPLVSRWVSQQFQVSDTAGWQWGIALGSAVALVGAVLWVGIRQTGESATPVRHAG